MQAIIVACMLQASTVFAVFLDRKAPTSIVVDSRGLAVNRQDLDMAINQSINQSRQEVPKIIHFMYKETLDENSTWPNEVWKASFKAWKRYFPEPEYTYHFWNDTEIINFFTRSCGKHATLMTDHTLKFSDYARLCILQEYGGIYSDLDYEPRSNFYADLMPGQVNLIQSPYPWEGWQNSLMASPADTGSKMFWASCLDLAQNRSSMKGNPSEVSGPKLFDALPETYTRLVHVLPCDDFQHAVPNGNATMSTRAGCEFLAGNDFRQVKGVHWGTWNHVGFGKGLNQHEGVPQFKNLFHVMHEAPDSIS